MDGKIYVFKNPEKGCHERWEAGRSLANIPCPFRGVLFSRPNGGKTTLVLNLILQAKPHYNRIFLLHPKLRGSGDESGTDEEDTDVPEYDSIDYEPLYEIPDHRTFNNGCSKQLLIIDDLELRTISKEQRKRLNKVASFASSHYNLSILITSQDSFSQVPASILRFMNWYCVWKYNDLTYMRMLLNRMGISGREAERIMNEMNQYGEHDFLTIDRTDGAPAVYRRNMFTPVLTE